MVELEEISGAAKSARAVNLLNRAVPSQRVLLIRHIRASGRVAWVVCVMILVGILFQILIFLFID
jgi:hypothetical protein